MLRQVLLVPPASLCYMALVKMYWGKRENNVEGTMLSCFCVSPVCFRSLGCYFFFFLTAWFKVSYCIYQNLFQLLSSVKQLKFMFLYLLP